MPRGRKPKYDYRSKEFLDQIKALAERGYTDTEIALTLGLNSTHFADKKTAIPELSEVLTRARAQVNAVVRQKYLQTGLGGLKVKTVTRRLLDSGDSELVHETETELSPNPSVLNQWLYAHDPDWKRMVDESKRLDLTTNGKDLNGLSDEQLNYVVNELLTSIGHGNKENID